MYVGSKLYCLCFNSDKQAMVFEIAQHLGMTWLLAEVVVSASAVVLAQQQAFLSMLSMKLEC